MDSREHRTPPLTLTVAVQSDSGIPDLDHVELVGHTVHLGDAGQAASATEIDTVRVANPAHSFCPDAALTSCLLVLFLAAGASLSQRGSTLCRHALVATPTPPIRPAGSAPDLHALGISRT